MPKNILEKRVRKFKGLLHQSVSYILLRHTPFNFSSLQKRIAKLGVRRLHVGCGDVLLKGWLNIKYEPTEEYGRVIDKDEAHLLNYNLLKPWPVFKDSIDFIAGSHFIEHLDLNAGIKFVEHSFKVLRAGGVIRLSCPDLERYARNYVERNQQFFQNAKIREWCAFKKAATPGEIFIAKAYDSGGAHKWFYDFESLKHILESGGFRQVKRVGRLEGRTPDLTLIEPEGRELETVYVEALKE